MEFLFGCFLLLVVVSIACAVFVGAVMFVVGTIILVGKLIVWLAYLGFCFIILGLIGCALAKLFTR